MTSKYIKSIPSGEVGGAFKVSFWGRFSGASILLLMVALFVTSCSDDDDGVFDEAWKQKNEEAFAGIAKNPEYNEIKSQGNNGSIYYKVLKKGEEGAKKIFYNSRAEVYYKGFYVATNENIKAGDVFDHKLFEDGSPYYIAVSSAVMSTDSYGNVIVPSVIEGWTVALQEMVVGDKWEVWIPYQLAYGQYDVYNNGRLTMKGSTTLAFEIELVKAIDFNEF